MSVPTLPVSRATIPAFHRWVAAKSTTGSPARIPIASALRIFSTSPATVMSALEGMHPQFRQTPPRLSCSMQRVRFPSAASRMAAV
ncbi:MAG TPA: hypothetical protein VFX98_04705 [Longimicrobiaceae bacterium]|nr:hypothetical protein [Longimicrobiaceae bacterium]